MVRAVIPPELDPTWQRGPRREERASCRGREAVTNAVPAGAVSVIIVGPRVC